MPPAILLLLTALAGAAVAADYEVGERLAPADRDRGAERHQEVTWDDLLPPDWDPMQVFEDLDVTAIDELEDDDPRAEAALAKLRAMWNEAPPNPVIAGKAIRIPGFMVPLEFGDKAVTEFLLVPYFGACIHVPPPPANQIIQVHATDPYATESYMDAVWVEGRIELAESSTELGDSGYRLQATRVEPYEEPN
jgi:hypothetical protein